MKSVMAGCSSSSENELENVSNVSDNEGVIGEYFGYNFNPEYTGELKKVVDLSTKKLTTKTKVATTLTLRSNE